MLTQHELEHEQYLRPPTWPSPPITLLPCSDMLDFVFLLFPSLRIKIISACVYVKSNILLLSFSTL